MTGPDPARRAGILADMAADVATAANGLRRAAALLEPCLHGDTVTVLVDGWTSNTTAAAVFPPCIGGPLAYKMLSAATDLEHARSLYGRPIAYVLQIAGALLGENLPGSNQ